MDPASHGGTRPVRIDTHGAIIALAGATAWKMKRAVVYPYLDYGTPARRRQALEAELALNRPLAPAIYQRVAAITREADGTLKLEGVGEPVEAVLVMRRFDEHATLDRIVAERPLTDREVDTLARAIVAAHAAAPPADGARWVDDLALYLAQNEVALAREKGVPALSAAARTALHALRPLLAARAARGLVRRCHGDLHLGNIALIDGEPTLFDAIEFDDRIASGDVLYDLAFTLMDLCLRGRRENANRLLNRTLVEAAFAGLDPDGGRDLDGLRALPFFQHLRAAIRAKIALARATALADAADAAAARAEAGRYLAFARAALDPPPPVLVAVGGLSGTGKTTVAMGLAPALGGPPGAVVLRSDVERKHLAGAAETAHLPASGYTAELTERVFASLHARAAVALAAGWPVVLDAVHAQPAQRDAVRAVAAAAGVPFLGLWLVAPLEARLARVAARSGDASDADRAVVLAQDAALATGEAEAVAAGWHVLAADAPPAAVVEEALALVLAAGQWVAGSRPGDANQNGAQTVHPA
jgi:aminoglycoside phosphotransferase family enzyme/predicted kinase